MEDTEKEGVAPAASSSPTPQPQGPAALSPQELAQKLRARSSGELSAQKLPSGITVTSVPDASKAEAPEVSREENTRDIAQALGASELETADTSGSVLPRVRTYKSDLAGAVRRRKVSLIGMVAAESDRAGRTQSLGDVSPAETGIPRSRWLAIGIGALLVLSAAALGGAYLLTRTGGGEGVEITYVPAPLFTNAETRLVIDTDAGRTLMRRLTDERSASAISLGEIQHVRVLFGDQNELSAQTLLERIGTHVPQELVRAVYGTAMVGFHAFDRTQPFIIIPVASYENAFSGMLAWERFMREDLSPLFDSQRVGIVPSTGAFHDRVIRNIDTRILSSADEPESITLLYAFADKSTLIITTNDATLREVLARLAATRSTSVPAAESIFR